MPLAIHAIKRVVPAGMRHRAIHSLPMPLRHRLVDHYIDRQVRTFARLATDPSWLRAIPGWEYVSPGVSRLTAAEAISNFWRSVPASDSGNSPTWYASSAIVWDVDWLRSHVDALLAPRARVLDFGCNAGRVLHHLVEAGYSAIGVDINADAIAHGQRTFPVLTRARFVVGDAAEPLRTLPDRSVDVAYSCAALRHVAPEKIDTVIAELTRVSSGYVITLEDEGSFSYRTFPHDYRSKFGALGWHVVTSEYAIDRRAPIDIGGIGTMLRVYARIRPQQGS